jgi:hypothetical protein
LERDCHLIEIDLLRDGEHSLSIPEWRLQEIQPFESTRAAFGSGYHA